MPYKGYKRSEESRQNYRLSKLGDKNPMWKGDNVSYGKLHAWIRDNLPVPKECANCNEITRLDACNITGIYNREFKNWKYLCRKCHMESDGRLDKLNNQSFDKRSEIMKKIWVTRNKTVVRDDRGRIVNG